MELWSDWIVPTRWNILGAVVLAAITIACYMLSAGDLQRLVSALSGSPCGCMGD